MYNVSRIVGQQEGKRMLITCRSTLNRYEILRERIVLLAKITRVRCWKRYVESKFYLSMPSQPNRLMCRSHNCIYCTFYVSSGTLASDFGSKSE